MRSATHRWVIGVGSALLVLGVGAATAAAQRPPVRGGMPARPATPPAVNFDPRSYYQQFPPFSTLRSPALPVNPNYWVAPGLTLNQYAYNMSVLGQALGSFPPWAFGYNPYPVVTNYGPFYNVTPLYNPFLNPYGGYPIVTYYGNPYLWP